MFKTFRELLEVLTPSERRKALLVFLLMLVVALLETAGVASILPFISVLADPESIERNIYLSRFYEFTAVESTADFIVLLGVIFLVVQLVSLTAKATSQWMQLNFSTMRVHAIGYRLIRRYLAQPYDWFLSQHTSKLSTTVLSEVNQIISSSLFPAMQMVAQGVVVISLLTFLLIVNPLVAIIAGASIGAAYGLVYFAVRRPLERFGRWRFQANRKRFKVTQETFGGIKDVKMSGLEANMLAKFEEPSRQTAAQQVKVGIIKQLPGFFMQGLLFTGIVGLLLYLSAVHGSMMEALPTFAAFAFAGYRLMPALQQIYSHLTSLRAAGPSLQALIQDLRQLKPYTPQTEESGEQLPPFKGSIELSNIQYAYPGTDLPALRALNMVIPAHKQIGLVGSTGSGKSTTVDVILGLLQPQSGEMKVDGRLINDDNVRAWRRRVGYVPQHIFLSDDTLAGNIAFGLPAEKVSMEAVIRAAKVANLHDFVLESLPDGYETLVGERGTRLSGGQRQRVGIARALYHDPEVIVMDEATSALDNLTEKAVMEAVDNLSGTGTKTIVMIAHRLTTVKNCDVIYLLEKGRVVDSGTYHALIESSESFRAMSGV